jgi:hypothetical protein
MRAGPNSKLKKKKVLCGHMQVWLYRRSDPLFAFFVYFACPEYSITSVSSVPSLHGRVGWSRLACWHCFLFPPKHRALLLWISQTFFVIILCAAFLEATFP